MSRRWLLALLALTIGACTCPPAESQLKAFAPAKIYQDDIKQCEAYGNCDALCISLFSLDTSQAVVEHCVITHVDDNGAAVSGWIQYDNVCAVDDGDFVIGDDGSSVDDGGDSGDDGTVDDGSGDDGSSDDGTVDDGGGDDGSTGDDGGGDDGGGDDGGGDDGSLAPHHHPVVKQLPTGSRA